MQLATSWTCTQRPWEGMMWEAEAERTINAEHALLALPKGRRKRWSSQAEHLNSDIPKRFTVGTHFKKGTLQSE